MQKRSIRKAGVAALVGAMLLSGTQAVAQDILPPTTHPGGFTYSELGAGWWEWALTQPAPINPLIDETGEHCAVGQLPLQDGHGVWYLAGSLGGAANRTCEVPVNRTLVFPLINTIYLAYPYDPPEQRTEEFLREQTTWIAIIADGLSLTIDDAPVDDLGAYFEASTEISLLLPEDNIFGLTDPSLRFFDTGYDAGFYVAIPAGRLGIGEHTLHWRAVQDDAVAQDITYTIIVTQP